MKNFKILGLMLCLFLVVMSSCKKDKDENYYEYKEGGDVQMTINGTTRDGVALNESFLLNQYKDLAETGYSQSTSGSDTYYYVTINKEDVNTGSSIYIRLIFKNSVLVSGDTDIELHYYKELENNRVLAYIPSISSSDIAASVTFDPATGKVAGTITCTGKQTSGTYPSYTTHTCSISAKIDMTVPKVVSK